MSAAASRELKLAVVGATGAVGSQIVELIDARGLSCAELGLFATEQGAARTVEAMGAERLVVELHDPSEISRYDIAFLAVPASWAADIARARPGPVLIDLSAAGHAPSADAAFVAPGFTPPAQVVELARRNRYLGIPHPASYVLASVLEAADAKTQLVCATLMVGASSAGRENVQEVARETAALLSGAHSLEEGETQRAFNAWRADSAKELADVLAAQTGALLGTSPRLLIDIVNAGLLHGSAMTVLIPEVSGAPGLAARLRAAPGLVLVDDEQSASVDDAVGQEAVLVAASVQFVGAAVWCAFDSTRLAALHAVWAAEKIAGAAEPGVA
jgi:aspartate-semialdehyde dehydrogenase